MNYEDLRISKIRDYLFGIINTLTTDDNYQINADMLSDKIGDYSLNKIPTDRIVEKWITGFTRYQDIYSFRSRRAYTEKAINNLLNIGFFETFEKIIEQNNKNGILPQIDGIESIECLNCGTLNVAQTNTATFDIQIRIIYHETDENSEVSL